MWSSKRSSSAFSRAEIGAPLPGFLHTDWYRRIWNQRDGQPGLVHLHAISLVADACQRHLTERIGGRREQSRASRRKRLMEGRGEREETKSRREERGEERRGLLEEDGGLIRDGGSLVAPSGRHTRAEGPAAAAARAGRRGFARCCSSAAWLAPGRRAKHTAMALF